MTRENKLSIVVAFALLIFVGMLFADHFSIASKREVAALGHASSPPPPPLVGRGRGIEVIPQQEVAPNIKASNGIIHVVLTGETLRSICLSHYANASVAKSLAKWNNIKNPDQIERGTSIALPSINTLMSNFDRSLGDQLNRVAEDTSTVAFGKYEVKQGDTLSEIAQKVMGTVKKSNILIDMNKDVMPNPNNIRPGMVLLYPLQTS
jgi:LysM repeat protein